MSKNKVYYISFINVIAAVAVVVLHADSSFWHYANNDFWPTANVIDAVFYFAVPVFFMLSGATLIDYSERYSTREFFKKRFVRTVIPFLFWSVFALFWSSRKTIWAMMTGAKNNGLGWTFNSVVDGIVNTKFMDIYWFFIPLFFIYLTIPLFAAIPEKKRIRIFSYIIAVCVPLNFVIPFALTMLKIYTEFKMSWTYAVYIGFEYMIYPLIGYVLHKKELRLKWRLVIYAAALAGMMTQLIGTYFATVKIGIVDYTVYKGYYKLPCLLYATGAFLFLKNVGMRIKSEKANRFFAFLQGYTFPIYLIHRYFLKVFEENCHLLHLDKNSLLYVVCATILALLLSILTTMLLRKIPILRRVVP